MTRLYCPFHTDEDVLGIRLEDGAFDFACERSGHPNGAEWRWLHVPDPVGANGDGLGGLADELNLVETLPAVLRSLGEGWFEYGLVERAYAAADPEGFTRMVTRWGHTALAKKRYTASSYLAGTLGRLSAQGTVAYHPGSGTGRWSYNSDISFWSALPAGAWSNRHTWVDEVGDASNDAQTADLECRAYVHGA